MTSVSIRGVHSTAKGCTQYCQGVYTVLLGVYTVLPSVHSTAFNKETCVVCIPPWMMSGKYVMELFIGKYWKIAQIKGQFVVEQN